MILKDAPDKWFLSMGIAFVGGLLVCALAAPMSFVGAYAVGGALVVANAYASSRKLAKTDFSHKGRAFTSLIAGFYVRLVLIGICLYVCIKYLGFHPLGLVVGLSVVPAGLVVMLILTRVANRRVEEA
ncbi:MAG: ATP synthase subunit I [Thermodesulfobacteriota bacterium]